MTNAAGRAWKPLVTRMSDVAAEEVEWLWNPYIPIGKLTLLEGDPGLGKTWLALAIAAAVTNGQPPFHASTDKNGPHTQPRNVIYMSAEDGLGDTLKPRLIAAGADDSRIFAITGKRHQEKGQAPLDDAISFGDIPALRQAVEEIKPALLVVDPLQAYLGASVDMHRANEVRPALSPIADLAEEFGFAALLIRHLRKSSSSRAVHRGLGSIDFSAVTRSMLLIAEDPEVETRRVMAHVKGSLTHKGSSIAFELRDNSFVWLGKSPYSAEELLAPVDLERQSALSEATEWLEDALSGGPVMSNQLKEDALRARIGWRTLQRAKKLGGDKFVCQRVSSGNSGGGLWRWELASASTPGTTAAKVTETAMATSATPTAPSRAKNNVGGLATAIVEPDGDMVPARPPTTSMAALPDRHVGPASTARPPTDSPDDRFELISRTMKLIDEFNALSREDLRERYKKARTLAKPPKDWRDVASDNPLAVTVAMTLLAEDIAAGLTADPARYLSAALGAVEFSRLAVA